MGALGGLAVGCAGALAGAAAGAGAAGAAARWGAGSGGRRAAGRVGAVGAGAVLGAALGIVLPEGFEALALSAESLPHWAPGLLLCLGFLLMMLLEAVGPEEGGCSGPEPRSPRRASPSRPYWGRPAQASRRASQPAENALRQVGAGAGGGAADFSDPADVGSLEDIQVLSESGRKRAHADGAASSAPGRVLTGLLVHSLADGLAMGAAAASDNDKVNFSVTLAILLHKAPAAFGLTTYLLNSRWSRAKVVQGAAAFCLASPVGAVLTYLVFRNVPSLASVNGVASALVFSAGTLLHSACMHMIPESLGKRHPNGREQRLGALGFFLMGMAIPLLADMVHGE